MWRREDVIQKLRDKQGERSLRTYATELGVSAAYLSDLYRGRRDPGPAVLKPLGLERKTETVVTYVKRRWR